MEHVWLLVVVPWRGLNRVNEPERHEIVGAWTTRPPLDLVESMLAGELARRGALYDFNRHAAADVLDTLGRVVVHDFRSGYLVRADLTLPVEADPVTPAPVPCGALVVTRTVEGSEAEVRWCDRVDGPCPFPGAPRSKDTEFACATSGTRLFRVQWHPDAIARALTDMQWYRDSRDVNPGARPADESVQIAVDALRTVTEP